MTVVNEPLNPEQWTTEQQQAIYDQLAMLLGVPPVDPPISLPSMTDTELSDYMGTVIDEIKTRPAAEVTLVNSIYFEGDTIQEEAGN